MNSQTDSPHRRGLQLTSGGADVHLGLGNASLNLNRVGDAIASYRSGLMIEPCHVGLLNNLGVALQRAGRVDEAEATYRRVLSLEPGNADGHNNLGHVLMMRDELPAAAASYRRAVGMEPGFAGAHANLGNTLSKLGDYEQACECYRRALQLNPHSIDTHVYFGDALLKLGEPAAAMASYRRALTLRPGHAQARIALGDAMKLAGDVEDALDQFRRGGREAYARMLETLYEVGDGPGFEAFLRQIARSEPNNIVVSALSAFVACQWDIADIYRFCQRPLDYVRSINIADELAAAAICIDDLATRIKALKSVWQPYNKATRNGFQTAGNLFESATLNLGPLLKVLRSKIRGYRDAFTPDRSGFIRDWPQEHTLVGWSVRLLEGGYQEAHIHPSGWLSGVLYLKTPSAAVGNEGGIEFSLRALKLNVLKAETPGLVLVPKAADLILFPSSLFHRTLPFYSDEERICIAFDVTPIRA